MKIDQSWKGLNWQHAMYQYWFFILNLTRVIRGLIPCLIPHWFPTLHSILNTVTNTVSLYKWRIASNQREGKLVRVIIWNAQFVFIFQAVNRVSHKESYAFSFWQSRDRLFLEIRWPADLNIWEKGDYIELPCTPFTSKALLLLSFESLTQF